MSPIAIAKGYSSAFTHVVRNYANFSEQKELFTQQKSQIPIMLVWEPNMAAVSLFCTPMWPV